MKLGITIRMITLLLMGACIPGCSKQPSEPTSAKPSPLAATSTAAAPCSVQIWEDENYQDSSDTIVGPGKWSNMRDLPGANKQDWGDQIDSLKVSSRTTVIVWEDENYSDNSQTYGPGTEKTNLRGEPNMGDQIDSMEIRCAP